MHRKKYRRRRKLRNIETSSRRRLNDYSILRNPSSQGQAAFGGCYRVKPPAQKILEYPIVRRLDMDHVRSKTLLHERNKCEGTYWRQQSCKRNTAYLLSVSC